MDRGWSVPAVLSPLDETARYVDLAFTGAGAYVSQFFVRRPASAESRSHRATLLQIRAPDGRWIDAPPGEFTFAYPRIAVDRRGTLHVVWAEPAPGDTSRMGSDPSFWNFASLWHAALMDGRWSTPQPVYRGAGIGWEPGQVSPLRIDGSGSLHLALSVSDGSGVSRILHLRGYGSGWSHSIIPIHSPPAYVDMDVDAAGGGALVYALAYRDSLGWHTNTILVRRTDDGGRTWGDAIRVSLPEQGPGYDPRLARGRGDTLHLLWTQSESANANATIGLWHTRSADGGASWTAPVRSPLTGMTHQMQAVADSCGGVHVVISDFSRLSLVHTRLLAAPGDLMQTPFSGMAGGPALGMDLAGRLHLVWTETVLSGPGDSVGQTRLMHSTLDACTGRE